MAEHHTILGGKVHVYKRRNSSSWQCATLREFDIMTQGQRSAKYASGQHARANGYLIPFFGSMVLPEITAGKVNEYRVHRLEECKALRGKPPARSTMHQEIVTHVDSESDSAGSIVLLRSLPATTDWRAIECL